MPLYKYKYIKGGKNYEEVKEFLNKEALYNAVRSDDGSILLAEEVRSRGLSFKKFFSFRKKVKPQEVITFAKNLAAMVDAGLTVSRAISLLGKQSKNKNFVKILDEIIVSVNGGETLSASLGAYPDIFSGLFVSMVKAGEESGKLVYALKIVVTQLEKSHALSKKIKGAMIYPIVIISVMLVIGIILMVYMVPMLTETFVGLNIKLPLPTRVIIAISDFLKSNLIISLGVLLVLIFSFMSGLKTKKGKRISDYIILRIPLIKNMTKEVNAARTARTLSSLVSSGVEIVAAINITSAVLQNHYFKDLLNSAAKQVEIGEPLSISLSNTNGNLYPIFVGEMLAVGEETGKMTEMLDNIASYYESEVDQKTKDLSTVIEPFLMIIIGIVVGVFAVAMMLPTYSLVDAIK